MRWLLLVTAACSFEHGSLQSDGPGSGSGSQQTDARPLDASIDAPLDANPGCLTRATKTYNGHHYFATSDKSWDASQAECASVSGHLVKIETSGENNFIGTNFATSGYVWIGLRDVLDADVYQWTDGSLLGAGYNAFPAATPPTSSTANCVDTNGTWDPYSCSYNGHGGVCECE